MSDRIPRATGAGLSYSAHTFSAPPGTRITGLRWAGRIARGNCTWGAWLAALPSGTPLLGVKPNLGCAVSGLDLRTASIPVTIPAGTTRLQQMIACGAAAGCQPGATFHTTASVVTIDDPTLPTVSASGALVSGRWVRGEQAVTVSGQDNTGVARTWVTVGSQTRSTPWACRYTSPQPCANHAGPLSVGTLGITSGQYRVSVGAQDAAGNIRTVAYDARIDNEPPGRVRPSVDLGQAWRRSNRFTIRWQKPPQTHAPIVRAWYRLCGPQGCETGQVSGSTETLANLTVNGSGAHSLEIWLEDAAGNQSFVLGASDPVFLRLDQEPPSLAFEPQSETDPLRVAVRASDSHSGVDTGEIEIRKRDGNTWHALAAAREGSALVAYVDDERFRSGAYEFRARVRDHAGNEASTDRRTTGARATIDLPARFATGLVVGRRKLHRHGKRRRVRLLRHSRARYGSRISLHGRLSNPDGQPLDAATIQVSSDSPGDAVGLVPVGVARTDRQGRFTYIARATRNRVLRFRYSGSRRIRSATADFTMSVPAVSSLRARPRRLRNGQSVRLSGRVRTRPLPASGKLIEVQAYFRGRFRTFSTTRADSTGRWRFVYRFGGTRGRVPYRLRAFIPAEGGYPFTTGRSPVARVIVSG
ncbi:MAG: hypothetical protein JW895_01540 [Thermoleophilaceae bacterium]|nr:hypothetical protein [Thermoleophilaceae bacterium]